MYKEALESMKDAWAENMTQALDQEKATSEKIDDVFEGYNTYKCWAEYLCRAVQFSEFGSPNTALTGLTKVHIGEIPGCQAPEDLGMPTAWSNFVNMLKADWQFIVDSANAGDANLKIEELDLGIFTPSALPFIPQCMAEKASLNEFVNMGDYSRASGNYANCMEIFNSRFGCKEGEDCSSPEIALVMVETALRENHADQKASVLENKLSSIIQKLHSTQLQTDYLKTNIIKLDKLYTCYPSKCD